MAVEEVVVDLTPVSEPVEVPVEPAPEQPTVQQDEPTPTKQEVQPTEQKVVQEPVQAQPEEAEKLRKERDALGYQLRKMQEDSRRRQQELEAQLQRERDRIRQRELAEQTDKELAAISHLKDVDPDAYVREYGRILDNRKQKELEEQKKAIEANAQISNFTVRQNTVETMLYRDFPELSEPNSDLMQSSIAAITARFPDEAERAYIQSHFPEVFYEIVGATQARLKIKALEAEKADKTRQARVSDQGVVEAAPKAVDTKGKKLTQEQLAHCKKYNLNPTDYAKYI